MVTMAQRIEALRTEAGLARVPASLELGFPKNAFEKFETGRQTPTKEQQEKIRQFLCQKFHVKEAVLSLTKDESLIGGFILRAGGREFDWSFRGRFQALSRVLQH